MRKHRILVVDDDLSMREFLKILLERSGYSVTVAASGEEALERLGKDQPDLVMTDLNMPGINGIELLNQVKAWAARSEVDVEVILVTCSGLFASFFHTFFISMFASFFKRLFSYCSCFWHPF